MLTAVNQIGEVFSLVHGFPKEELRSIRKEMNFYCPHCHERVHMRVGNIKFPHFSHMPNSSCSFSEGESKVHLQGKLDLYNWLTSHRGVHAELEPYLPAIGQRPDILFQWEDRIYSLEYQCSAIPIEDMVNRTKGYISADIHPIWILGPVFEKIYGASPSVNQLSAFQWSFFQHMQDSGLYLLSYCPQKKSLLHLSRPFPISSKKIYSVITTLPLHQLHPSQLSSIQTKQLKIPLSHWLMEKARWAGQRMRFSRKYKDPFLQCVYNSGKNLLVMSPQIGLPVPSMYTMAVHPIEWQFFVWYDNIRFKREGECISAKGCTAMIEERIKQGCLKKRCLPLLKIDHSRDMVIQYLDLLCSLGYMKRLSPERYLLLKPFLFEQNMLKSLDFEKKFYLENLMKINGQFNRMIHIF
ncbi:competence protein CoiA [Falsibacillus albus]|uniref:competence protein CoiA n=1 Tax=Falsibacillus albus TaxID=2478915 RepID=UPI0013145AEF|nr:competence protein CoiA family protein [Falsibacillus albus]